MVRADGSVVPAQFDIERGVRTATFLLPGKLEADACRVVTFGTGRTEPDEEFVRVEQVADYRGEPAFEITTPSARYVYHVRSSGFASLFDAAGHDWISYQPGGGFRGEYRGIPNIAPPDFHPGRPDGKKRSELLRTGPIRATILSETTDERWRLVWDVFPNHARMTLERKGPDPYWILYEGTPGGEFDPETDFWIDSTGTVLPMPEDPGRFQRHLPDPQWVAFSDGPLGRSLFLSLDPPDQHMDEFWHRGAGGMTVFGFGRGEKPRWQRLESVPAYLTIGLVDSTDSDHIRNAVESAARPLRIRELDY